MGKRLFSIIIILLISGLIFFGYGYATKSIKTRILSYLDRNFDAEFSIGSVGIYLPLCLELKDVKIDDSVDIRSIRIYPHPMPFLLKNHFIVSGIKVIDPVVRLKKAEGKEITITDLLKKKENASAGTPTNLYFSKIRIHNGTLVCDLGNANTLEFRGIKGKLENPGIYFLKDGIFHFAAGGFLKNKESEFLSPLKIEGIFDVASGVKTRLHAKDVKLDSFGPFYTKYLKNLIKEGRVDLKSDIKISKKYMIARCLLEGEDVVLNKSEDQKLDTPLVASFILLINFKTNLVKIKNLQGNFFKVVLDK